MANWKKVLVSGSSINVNQISGSTLNLSGLGNNNNDVLIIDSSGNISSISQGSLTGATQTFRLQGANTLEAPISFNASDDVMLFTTESSHGFSFKVSDDTPASGTSSIQLITPQDLATDANVNFNQLILADKIIHDGDTDNTIAFGTDTQTFSVNGNPNINISNASVVINESGLDRDFRIESNNEENIFFVNGETDRIGIGTNTPTNILHVSGGDLRIEGAITASLPRVTTIDNLVAYSSGSTGDESFKTITGLDFISQSTIGTAISGAFTEASAALATSIVTNASDIDTLTTNITSNDTDISNLQTSASSGIRFQEGGGAQPDGGSVLLGQTASFIGTANEVTIVHDGGTSGEEKFTFSLPDDVTIGNDLTVTGDTQTTNLTASGDISASGNLTVTGDVTLDGTLSFSGFSFIENAATVLSGSTVFGSESMDSTHVFTGSLTVTGSGVEFQGGGLSITQGGGLTVNGNINTDGSITSIGNISGSSISSSGEIVANLNPALDATNVVIYDNDTGTLFFTASNSIGGVGGGDGTLGTPSDTTYDDGLLDFTPGSTTINDAIDLINEVLGGLAPPPAPDLDDIDIGDVSAGVEANLSFGATNTSLNTYTAVSSSATALSNLGNSHTTLDVAGNFRNDHETGGDERFGAYSTLATKTGFKLNEDVTQDGTPFINYSASAFNNGNKGILYLYVNDIANPKATASLSSSNAAFTAFNDNSSGFSLTATASAFFPTNGQALDAFINRRGTFNVGANDQQLGYNFAFVEHITEAGASPIRTNFIEWVVDTDSSNLDASTSSSVEIDDSASNILTLSGVKYHKSFFGRFYITASNVYKNVYSDASDALQYTLSGPTNVIRFQNSVHTGTKIASSIKTFTNTTFRSTSLTDIQVTDNAHLSTLGITASISGGAALSANDSLIVDNADTDEDIELSITRIKHPLKSDYTTANTQTIKGILVANLDQGNNTTTREYFTDEDYRLVSGNYSQQSDIAGGAWTSTDSLNGSTAFPRGLLVMPQYHTGGYELNGGDYGMLVYPGNTTTNPQGGNFSTITHGPSNNANYSSLTNTNNREYYRYFTNSTGGTPNTFTLKIRRDSGLGHGSIDIVPVGTSLSTNDITIETKLPGLTAWLDVGATNPQDDGNDLTVDGAPGRIGNVTAIGTSLNTVAVCKVANGTTPGFIADGNSIIIRITAASSFARSISEIQVDF